MTTPKRILQRATQYSREVIGRAWEKTTMNPLAGMTCKEAYLVGYLEGRLDEAGKLELPTFEFICNDCKQILKVVGREPEHADQTATFYHQWSKRDGIWRCSTCHEEWQYRPRRQKVTGT